MHNTLGFVTIHTKYMKPNGDKPQPVTFRTNKVNILGELQCYNDRDYGTQKMSLKFEFSHSFGHI